MARLKQLKKAAGWTAFGLFLLTQFPVEPWWMFANMFFASTLFWQTLDAYYEWRLWKVVVIVGGTLNWIAIAVNHGRMPVLGRTETHRWWQPLTDETRLPALCDIYWKVSIGDMFIAASLLLLFAAWIYGKFNAPERETESDQATPKEVFAA